MDLITQFKTMAQYNMWMNRSIYDTCATLSDEERKRDQHAFFGSIHRTLNHLLLTDRVQMGALSARIARDHSTSTAVRSRFARWTRNCTRISRRFGANGKRPTP